ncbi:HEPN domain-containing protein [Paeniglutamicibacter sp.]|uniref:HEPN domain-containing protein n=1 Tax=Paeniglutamicibacter sp. TaxID=1934391 RepID=UPI003988C680
MNLHDFRSSLQACRDLAEVLEVSLTNVSILQSMNVGPDIRTAAIAGSVLLSVARFEEFIKSRADHYLKSFSKASPPITRSSLDKKLQTQILVKNLTAAGRSKNHGVERTEDEILQELHNIAGKISSDTIWGDHAIETKSNPGPETVRDILSLLGISGAWTYIDTEFSSLWDTEKALEPSLKSIVHPKDELETILLWRNQCAHTGQSPTIGPAEIRNMILFLECLSSAIDKILSTHHSNRVSGLGSVPAPW